MDEALKTGLDAILERQVYLAPGGNLETRRVQRAILEAIYSDYYAPRHDVFVTRYNRESDLLALAGYHAGRGLVPARRQK